jgi:uncharacterized repeat protein (TIGR04052 family)
VVHRLLLIFPIIWLLAGCSDREAEIAIPFLVEFDGQETGCGTAESAPALGDLRFYVSAPEIVAEDGRTIGIELVPDGIWQQADIALMDFEDGTLSCENGTTEINTSLRVRLPNVGHRGFRFTIGVPFEHNHDDPLLAEAPLGDSAMHWHWRAGYKFLRAAIKTPTDGFWIHLGSTGCQGTVQDITGCNKPNRVNVNLPDFVIGEDSVVVNLSGLVADTDLGDGIPSDCSSGPAEDACVAPFKTLGLEFESGKSLDTQTVFKQRESL